VENRIGSGASRGELGAGVSLVDMVRGFQGLTAPVRRRQTVVYHRRSSVTAQVIAHGASQTSFV
jgi:hypothetical protein